MITWITRIIALIASVPLFMSGHWIWGIIALVIGFTFKVTSNGKLL